MLLGCCAEGFRWGVAMMLISNILCVLRFHSSQFYCSMVLELTAIAIIYTQVVIPR